MKCPKCGKDHVQILSECIQTNEHEAPGLLSVLKFIFSCVLIFSIIYLLYTLAEWNEKEYINILDFPSFAFALRSLVFSATALMVLGIIQYLFPLKNQTNTKAVCVECGKTWYIEINLPKKQETEKTQELNEKKEVSPVVLTPEQIESDERALAQERKEKIKDTAIAISVFCIAIFVMLFIGVIISFA